MGIRLDRFCSDFCLKFYLCQLDKTDQLVSAFFQLIDGMKTTNHGLQRRQIPELIAAKVSVKSSRQAIPVCGGPEHSSVISQAVSGHSADPNAPTRVIDTKQISRPHLFSSAFPLP